MRERVAAWWQGKADKTCGETVQTYYGPQSLHEVLERATWHIGQHCRQWMMLLDMAGIAFEPPLGDARFRRPADAEAGLGRLSGSSCHCERSEANLPRLLG